MVPMSRNLLQVQKLHKAYGSKILFDEANVSINSDEHIGVIGPNGAGKTTFFRILLGEEEADGGQIIRALGLRVGYLSQHDAWLPEETALSYWERKCSMPLWELEQKSRELGLLAEHLRKPVLSLSGGYRMRVKMLALIGEEPDLLLLDEPTNYLDLETTLVLERFLQSYEKAFLLISHDREFLKRTTDHTLEIESGELTKYPGNIEDYFEQKALLRSQLEAQSLRQEEKKRAVLDFVARFGAKATKAKQAQSRLKSLAKMEKIELRAIPIRAHIPVPVPSRLTKIMLQLKNASFGYLGKPVVRIPDLALSHPARVGVVGWNGVGKSTLLKGIAGKLEPIQGERLTGPGVTLAYFGQHVAEELFPEDTVLQALERESARDVGRQTILDLAGALLFSGTDVQKPISVLSGGEKTRVAFGKILLKRAGILVLDEPTNHLDFDTVEALINALQEFSGTLIVVSHDRGFLSRVATQILAVERPQGASVSQAIPYLRSYEEYLDQVRSELFDGDPKRMKNQDSPQSKTSKKTTNLSLEKPQKLENYQIDRKLKKIEDRLAMLEDELREVNLRLASGTLSADELSDHLNLLSKLDAEKKVLEEDWMKFQE
jgi:ATP-binding cassette subfamily F protein 3